MFTAPLNRGKPKHTDEKAAEGVQKQPQPIIDMLTSKLTKENIEELGFLSWPKIQKEFQTYLSGQWEAGYGGLPRCLRICLLAYSVMILKIRFGVKTWKPDSPVWDGQVNGKHELHRHA